MYSSYETPSSSPVPFLISRALLSLGMFTALAARIAARKRAFPSGSPPPSFAAVMISRVILVNALPRRASAFPFLCLIELHLLWPDTAHRSVLPVIVKYRKEKAPAPFPAQGPKIKFGGDLLSHGGNPAVPSALESLTAVFGMGTGVASPPSPPKAGYPRNHVRQPIRPACPKSFIR